MTETAATESARRRYKPDVITVLFIGESPPSGGTFFYFCNSKLYRATERAFRDAVPQLLEDGFLDSFRRLGCYLDDLCLKPVNQLKKGGRAEKLQLDEERQAGEEPLAKRIEEVHPRAFVLIGLGIESNVRRAVKRARCYERPFYALPFPNWPRDVTRFHNDLGSALVEISEQGLFALHGRA